jgi:hypothetical protein
MQSLPTPFKRQRRRGRSIGRRKEMIILLSIISIKSHRLPGTGDENEQEWSAEKTDDADEGENKG